MWLKKIDLNAILNNAESVCNALGLKLGQSWKMYVSELPKMPWTSIFLASLEVDCFDDDIKPVSCALYMTDLMASRARILATNKQK